MLPLNTLLKKAYLGCQPTVSSGFKINEHNEGNIERCCLFYHPTSPNGTGMGVIMLQN